MLGVVHCTNCGAKLLAENLGGRGCPYCGAALPHEVRAAEQAQIVQHLLADRNQDGIPDALEPLVHAARQGDLPHRPPVHGRSAPRGYAARASGHAPEARRAKRRVVGPVIVAAMALMVLGVVGAAVAIMVGSSADVGVSRTTSPGALGEILSNGPKAWSASAAGCAIDANADRVLDHVGMSGDPGDAHDLTLVDGATGKLLHTGQRYDQSSDVHCLDERWFVVAQPNFQLDFYDARKPQVPVRVSARDKLRDFALGDGCAAFVTQDGTRAGVALPAGTSSDCKVGELSAIHDPVPGLLGLTAKSGSVKMGRRVYTLEKRAQGTEILTLTVSEGRRQLWRKELPYASATFSSGLAVADSVIVLWAAEPANRQQGVLVGLEEKSGRQLYQKPQGERTSNSIRYIGYNGRYVVVSWWTGLFAYDPATGEVAWQVGRGS